MLSLAYSWSRASARIGLTRRIQPDLAGRPACTMSALAVLLSLRTRVALSASGKREPARSSAATAIPNGEISSPQEAFRPVHLQPRGEKVRSRGRRDLKAKLQPHKPPVQALPRHEVAASRSSLCWSQYQSSSHSSRRMPNPSLKRSANGRPPGPAAGYGVHFPAAGPGVLPLSPA